MEYLAHHTIEHTAQTSGTFVFVEVTFLLLLVAVLSVIVYRKQS